MRKIFYDSVLAKKLLYGCHTITIGPFIFSKLSKERMAQGTRNHECVHTRQWVEMTSLSGILLMVLVLCFGVPAEWMLLSGVIFYIWYVVEWLIRLVVYSISRNGKDAYKMVSFEREAYENENDSNYLENCMYFTGWLKFLFK